MFAGVEGEGAMDAWWQSALDLEYNDVHGIAFTAGAIDIAKCFDQISRDLLYEVCKNAGMPPELLDAYSRYQEGLQHYNTLMGNIGRPYQKALGIPQGDPYSMMLTALLLTPWLNRMIEIGVKPRILADDMFIIAEGPHHQQLFEQAVNETHSMLKQMGAKVASGKSTAFSTCPTIMVWRRGHKWKGD